MLGIKDVLSLSSVVALAVVDAAGPLPAQRTQQVSSQATCQECQIKLELVATLGEDDEGHIPAPPADVLRDAAGRVFVSFFTDITQVYDSTGRFLARLGRPGDGPGEYKGGQVLALGPGDTLFAFSPRQNRVSVLDPSLRFDRSEKLPERTRLHHALALGDGRFVLSGVWYSPERAGYGLHRWQAGALVRPGGLRDDRTMKLPFQDFLLTRSATGAVWVAPSWPYRIELQREDGSILRRFERRANWFRYYPTSEAKERGPQSRVVAIRERRDGTLLIAANVPAPDWRKHEPRANAGGEIALSAVDFDGSLDTVLELIDPTAERLIVAARTPHYIFAMPDAGHVASYSVSADGVPLVRIWKVRITGQ